MKRELVSLIAVSLAMLCIPVSFLEAIYELFTGKEDINEYPY